MTVRHRPLVLGFSFALALMLCGPAALPCEQIPSFGPTNPTDGARSVPANSKLFVTVQERNPEDVVAELNDPRTPVPIPLEVTVLAPGLVMVDPQNLDPNIEYSTDVRLEQRQLPDLIRVSFQATDTPDLEPPRWNSARPTLSTQTEAVDWIPRCTYNPGYRVQVEFPSASDDNLAAYILYVEEVDGVRAADIALAKPQDPSRLQLNSYTYEAPLGCYFVEAIDLAGHKIRISQPDCTPTSPPMDPPSPPIEPRPMIDPGDLETTEPGCECTRASPGNTAWALWLLGALGLRRKRNR